MKFTDGRAKQTTRFILAMLIVTGLWAMSASAAGAALKDRRLPLVPPAPAPPKVAYLTLDDGPEATYTPQVLEVLRRYKVRATFFVAGYMVQTHPEILLNTYYDGHAIGNHTFSHKYAELYGGPSPDGYLGSLKQNEDLINSVIGIRPKITRPPGGAAGNFSAGFYQVVPATGYRTTLWTVNSGDKDPGATTQTMINNVQTQVAALPPGTPPIILMHDTHAATAVALPVIIEFLKSQGYRFDVITKDRPPNLDNALF